jgi:uncharacterized protein (DUF2062 family)
LRIYWSGYTFCATMKHHYLKFVKRFYKQLRSPKMRKNRFFSGLVHRISNRRLWKPCRVTVSHGLAIGMFFALMLPLPMQSLFAAFFAIRARVNVPFAMLAVWISNPLTSLPLALMQEQFGGFVRHNLHVPIPSFLDVSGKFPYTEIDCNVANFVLGMLLSGVLASMLTYPVVHLISFWLPHHLPAKRDVAERGEKKPVPDVAV